MVLTYTTLTCNSSLQRQQLSHQCSSITGARRVVWADEVRAAAWIGANLWATGLFILANRARGCTAAARASPCIKTRSLTLACRMVCRAFYFSLQTTCIRLDAGFGTTHYLFQGKLLLTYVGISRNGPWVHGAFSANNSSERGI